jgi:predicted ArsR family transcriptional regulator
MADNEPKMGPAAEDMFRKKFATYKTVLDKDGPQAAWDALMEGYPERQRNNMGPLIDNMSLHQAFEKAIPIYASFGMRMTAMDISNRGLDAVLETHTVCPFMDMASELGLERPCPVVCDMDVAATDAAFDDITGKVLTRLTDGDAVCMFTYSRKAK